MSAATHIMDTLRPDAHVPRLNQYDVDITQPPEEIATIDRTFLGDDGPLGVEAVMQHQVRQHLLDLFFLGEKDGLLIDGETGEVHANVRRYKATPGQLYTIKRPGRGSRNQWSEPTRDPIGDNKRVLPEIDSTQDLYYFQALNAYPVHGIIGPSEAIWWKPTHQLQKNAWRDQLLSVRVYAAFEERFSVRIKGLPDDYQYDPDAPPERGLVNWQDLDIDWVLAELEAAQTKFASRVATAPRAEQLLRSYKIARANLENHKQRFADWRAGRSYEPLTEWYKRRGEVFRRVLGTKHFDMPAPPVVIDLEAEREKIAAKLRADLGDQIGAALDGVKAQANTEIRVVKEEARAEALAARARFEQQLAEARAEADAARKELALFKASIHIEYETVGGGGDASPAGGTSDAEELGKPEAGEGQEPITGDDTSKAFQHGKASAEADKQSGEQTPNPYIRKRERGEWDAGYATVIPTFKQQDPPTGE